MSTWNLGIDDVSEEAQAFKDKLSSKDSHIAAQQTKLMRQAAEMDELRSTFNDTLHKLSRETTRALQLESDLNIRSEDLRNEKIASQNVGQALAAAQEKNKVKELEVRDLLVNLESLSHTSDGHHSRSVKLEREKTMLEACVRELQGNIQQLTCPPTTPGRQRADTRPRSSSLSNFRITALEQELTQVRVSLSQKDADILLANGKASQAQNELIRVTNEKVAVEKRTSRRIADLQASLEDKEEELQYLRAQQDNGSREQELMERIDEDEAKIAALEKLLREVQGVKGVKTALREVEEKLKEERGRVAEGENRHIELIREKEDALDALEHAQEKISSMKETLTKQEALIRIQNADEALNQIDLMDVDPVDACSVPLPPITSDEVAVDYIERLLGAIERLRGERDTLQRSMLFLEHESKFAIATLEAKLASSSTSGTMHDGNVITELQTELGTLHARMTEVSKREAKAIQAKDQEIKRLSLAATASSIVIQHLSSQTDSLERYIIDAFASRAEELNNSQESLEELEGKVKELEVKLEVTVLCLEATTSQREDLISQLGMKDSEREEEVATIKAAHQQTRDDLEQAEIHLNDVSKALEDVESERNSLTLQITNLLTDLHAVQDDLTNAESRYSSLQFHQLSSMSSNEATQVLQDQISELEMRVMRRTEQIGIHQHDIKRMETNLRLQEERLVEMTTELEMMAEQKNAMVEDCADAREARDRALARLEVLEVDMEGRVEEGERAVETLVGVIFRTVGGARDYVRRLRESASSAKEELARLEEQHQRILGLSDEKEALLSARDSASDDVRQSTLALAVSQIGLGKALAYIHDILEKRDILQSKIKSLEVNRDRESSDITSLTAQLESLQHDTDIVTADSINCISELESQIEDLQSAISTNEALHQTAIDELMISRESLQINLNEARQSLLKTNIDNDISHLRAQHAQEILDIQARVDTAQAELEVLQASHSSMSGDLERALAEGLKEKLELERRLAEASESLRLGVLRQQEAEQSQKETMKDILHIQEELDIVTSDAREAQATRDELQTSYDRVLEELSQLQAAQESRHTELTHQSLAVKQQLEGDLADLQHRLDEQIQKLDIAVEESDRLARQLKDEVDGRLADKTAHEKELASANQQQQQSEGALTQLQDDMKAVQAQLTEFIQIVETLQHEKLCLLEEITTLEAEIQRSISLARFLESQVKESDGKTAASAEELEKTRDELARSEQAAKTAQVNLGLQNAQHKREMSELQRQLAVLKSQPNLQSALVELEERNNEMEELLRNKCTEIEENDDRALEMLKENKKLATKVESLTRKVQNLQTKLAAAKASIPKADDVLNPSENMLPSGLTPSSSSEPPISRARSNTLRSIPPVPPLPPIPTYAPSSVTRTPTYRAVSGPSSLPRPKTPERRQAQPPPVFTARTPERRAVVSTPPESMTSTSTIGKKRRAPDDFEACESVPPQGFTVDSLPSHDPEPENSTPRVRRVISGLQSGFTPVRHQNPRPTMPMPSPKRMMMGTSARSSPIIADVTNSPRATSSAKAKRSWLGKIRGNSTSQTAGRSGDSRPRFERESS